MNCKNCGAVLPSDAAFCEECGAAVMAPVYAQAHEKIHPKPPQKKIGIITGIIIVAVVIFAVSAIAVLRFSGIIGGGKPDGDTPDMPPSQEILTSYNSVSQNPSEQSASKSTEPDDSLGPNGESMQLSTTEIPTAEDFAWFADKSESWVYGITPAEAYTLEDFYALLGSWKGMQIIYDYDGTVLGYGFFTATFFENGSNAAATLNWHYIDWTDGSHEELTEREDESMTGSFVAPTITLGEVGNSIELIFYAMGGKQYAEGKWTVNSGEEVRVALVRP